MSSASCHDGELELETQKKVWMSQQEQAWDVAITSLERCCHLRHAMRSLRRRNHANESFVLTNNKKRHCKKERNGIFNATEVDSCISLIALRVNHNHQTDN
jgi:hypothetical protein